MATIYVDSAASGANDGTSKTDAFTSILNAGVTGAAAGDLILVSHAHSQNSGATASLLFANGTRSNPIRMLSMNFGTDVLTPGAFLQTGQGGGRVIAIAGNIYIHGMHFQPDGAVQINNNNSYRSHRAVLESCTIDYPNPPFTGAAGRIEIGHSGAQTENVCELLNCTWDATNGGDDASILTYSGIAKIKNLSLTPSTLQTYFIAGLADNTTCDITCEDCNFNGADDVFGAWPSGQLRMILRRCSIPPDWIGVSPFASGTPTPGSFLRLENCANGTISLPPMGLNGLVCYEGVIGTDLTRYRTGGATDGFDSDREFSWAMASNANALEIYTPLESPPMTRRVSAAGSPSGATARGLFHSTRCAPLSTPAALTTDATSTWNGSGVGTQQQVTVTLSNGQDLTVYVASGVTLNNDDFWIEVSEPDQVGGAVSVRAFLAVPSTTVYVDPFIDLS